MRILLVAYSFPPFNSVGALRPGKLARWLLEQGHEVQVLAASNPPFPQGLAPEVPPGCVTAVPGWSVDAPVEWLCGGRARVARSGFVAATGGGAVAARLGRLYKTLLHWPDGQLGWVGAACDAGRALLRSRSFDLVYASAPPFSVLRVASRLAREAGLPWVAELRDLWTGNPAYDAPAWRHALERRWESRLLRGAQALVTVSGALARRLRRFGPPVWVVRNGCDPQEFEGLPVPADFGQAPGDLDIAFTGHVYERHYDLDAFCAGLALDRARGGRARVHVAGRDGAGLQAAAQRHGVAHAFGFQPTVPRAQALAMQRHADVLLAFLWQGARREGVYSAKLFEYAAAGRPVLAVGAAGDVGRLVEAAGLGRVAADAAQVALALAGWRAHKRREGALAVRPAPGWDFSRASQFAALGRHLEELHAGRIP